MKKDVEEDANKLKTLMDKIRSSIKIEAESIKRLMDELMSDKLEQGNKLEETLKKEIQSQYKIYKEYNGYLEDFAGTINDYMLFDKVQSNPILCSPSEHFKIKPIPKTTKQSYPEITAGQYSKDDVAKLFGNISSSDTKPEKRRMIPKEILPTQLETSKKKPETEGNLL